MWANEGGCAREIEMTTVTPLDPPMAPEAVRTRLARELPHWTLEDGALRRRYRTGGWRATLMVANVVGHLAEAAWHHPELTLSYALVTVTLVTHSANGITAKDFALAQRIEEVVNWQPGRAADAVLEGTPTDDPRLRYIEYDEPVGPGALRPS
jgi:4a-hydroxytetrahydrobiopterin dehydratase